MMERSVSVSGGGTIVGLVRLAPPKREPVICAVVFVKLKVGLLIVNKVVLYLV